ncbi:mannose-1-phosphate guanylyltransferase [Flavilitoribacter nigricans]|uniref:mannose-1-phosphate guanylyltransferase n=1 Tax=Flavilitoribacter nigricans (strain ATCC 23147 / DSM 23189 / NBRC 102662 / NCIMB 1420 / SS-2) TaxID=1122177 RepID=A0A2D0NEV9_FLAN2|nr:mannose-1-phosphate guanylyltransferase [Flavilitoribacter nigricans]PHN07054.1 mannose-1-phosphate guanylyltransferase [Flavilitoribacter nigricans DSM 23189 = NBRC 102662]
MNNHTYVAIMAGGVGSRFWPASREARPKQFLDVMNTGKSLIRLTFERFLALCPPENIFIVTNKIYRDQVREHLPELTDNQILCEPSRNNTAPCIAYTALKLYALDPEANLIVAPSDHVILSEIQFIDTLKQGLKFTAENDALLTLGIRPTRPDTGYGYIRYEQNGDSEVKKVRQFTEKPVLERAREFLAQGDYLWNAGIFVWRVKTLLDAFQKNAREIYDILSAGQSKYNTNEEQDFIDTNYPRTPSISVDYAIMEKADNIYTIPSSFGWSDLGTWASLHSETEKDEQGNRISGAKIITHDTHNSLIRIRPDKLAVIGGLDDFIVVDEGDVLLIYPKNREQEIKALTAKVRENYGPEYL